MSDTFYWVIAAVEGRWNTFIEAARANPLWTLFIAAVIMGFLFAFPMWHAWMYLRLWYWQALVWRDKMLGRYKNFGKRARAADDLVRLVTKWTIEGTIKKQHGEHILRELAKAFSLNEIIPQKDVRPLHRYKVERMKEEIRSGKRKLAAMPGTEKNPEPKLPDVKKRTIQLT